MRKLIVALFALLIAFNSHSQDRVKNDLIVYGHIEVRGSSQYGSDSTTMKYVYFDSISVQGSVLNKEILNTLFKSINTKSSADTGDFSILYSDRIKSDHDSLNFDSLTVIAGHNVFNRHNIGGGKYSYVGLSTKSTTLAYSNSNKGGSFFCDTSGRAAMTGTNFSGSSASVNVEEDYVYFILGIDTLYKFKTDSLLAKLTSAKFKDISIDSMYIKGRKVTKETFDSIALGIEPPSGSTGDIQFKNGTSFGTAGDFETNWSFGDAASPYSGWYWGNSSNTEYLNWAPGTTGNMDWISFGTGSAYWEIYTGMGTAGLNAYNSSNYGGAFNVTTTKTIIKSKTSGGSCDLELNENWARLTNPDYTTMSGDMLVTSEISGCGYIGTLAQGDATPSVSNTSILLHNATSLSTIVTNLDDAAVGGVYKLIGNSDTYTISINDSGNFNLNGNWIGGANDILVLICIGTNTFVEQSRSDN